MQARNATRKLIDSHLVSGYPTPGKEIGLRVDQILQQDATGTLAMLELEAIGLDRPKVEVAVQYVDHNILQTDSKNMDDHLFLQSAAARFGYWFSRPGNGISHVVHMERFGRPGKVLLGADSHTCAGGALGMLAIGTGGLDAALAAVGEPYFVKMPKVLGIRLSGRLREWVSAKDVILELLRRRGVAGGRGCVLEYYGPGLEHLDAWDRHVIANMGAELGATATVFPSDAKTREFLRAEAREPDWAELQPDPGADYDLYEEIDLGEVEPLIAQPTSPGNVVPVREIAGLAVGQVVVGSSANPGPRDFWIVAEMMKGLSASPGVSFDVNPTSREVLQTLTDMGALAALVAAGARIHQSGCMGCIGMGQAPATGIRSLRTFPRNFPGRSGTVDDQVYLCSPETAAAAALTGTITDPRDVAKQLELAYPRWKAPEPRVNLHMLIPPPPDGSAIDLIMGPNIQRLPELDPLPDSLEAPLLLKMGDGVSTDEILRAGAAVLPLRSNIPAISRHAYDVIDPDFYRRAMENKETYGAFGVTAGENYAQGSSREHAALAPRFLGQRFVLAKSYARIGWQNLVNFGVIPFEFANPADWDRLERGDVLRLEGLHAALENGRGVVARVEGKGMEITLTFSFSPRQAEIILRGGVINHLKQDMEHAA